MRELAIESLADKRQLHRVCCDCREELDRVELEHGPEVRAAVAERLVDEQYAREGLPEWGLFSIRRPCVPPMRSSAAVPGPMRAAVRAWKCATTDEEVRELEYDAELAAREHGWEVRASPWLQHRLWARRRRVEQWDRIQRDVRGRFPRRMLAIEGKFDRINRKE